MTTNPGYPGVMPMMPDEKEHRRQIATVLNRVNAGHINVTIDVTLTANATTTTLTDSRIGLNSAVVPAMPTTAHGAAALAAGIWVSGILKGSCTINHANSANTDQTIRFVLIG